MAQDNATSSRMFRQSALGRLASADDLDKYIKVTNPSAWLILFAALTLVGGLVVWSCQAVIPTTLSETGIVDDATVLCWVDEQTASKIRSRGAHAKVLDDEATGIAIAQYPMSAAEVATEIKVDYLVQSVHLKDWNYKVTLTFDKDAKLLGDSTLVPVSITVSETHPIDLVLGNGN